MEELLMKLYDSGVYLVNGHDIVEEGSESAGIQRRSGQKYNGIRNS